MKAVGAGELPGRRKKCCLREHRANKLCTGLNDLLDAYVLAGISRLVELVPLGSIRVARASLDSHPYDLLSYRGVVPLKTPVRF